MPAVHCQGDENMPLILHLTPEQEQTLRREASQHGLNTEEYAIRRLMGEEIPPLKPMTTKELLALPREERERYLAAAAAHAAPLYEADLALPADKRELTAFTALNGEPFYDDDQ